MRLSFRLAREDDALYVGENLRQADRLEIERGTGHNPVLAPLVSVRDSVIAWAAVNAAGRTVAVFGVAAGEPGVGVVWLLATPEAQHEVRGFVHAGRYYVGLMERLFPVLTNAVDSENIQSLSWLSRLGFTEERTIPGPTGHPFTVVKKLSRYHHV